MMTADAVKTYAFSVGDGGRLISGKGDPDAARHEAGRDLDRLAKEYAAKFNVSYAEAYHGGAVGSWQRRDGAHSPGQQHERL